ncbi:hypothetical protein CHUAL_014022 [Chamberlinius hualienensis]
MLKRGGLQCSVFGCSNSYAKLSKWKNELCEIHKEKHEDCPCLVPYSLHRFPKNEELKSQWIAALQRKDFKPGTSARVCSLHFSDGRPTLDNPTPILDLGHDKNSKSTRKNITRKTLLEEPKTKQRKLDECQNLALAEINDDQELNENSDESELILENLVEVQLTEGVIKFVDAGIQCTQIQIAKKSKKKCKKVQTQPNIYLGLTFDNYSDEFNKYYTGLSPAMAKQVIKLLAGKYPGLKCKLGVEIQLILVFMRIKEGFYLKDLSFRFNISESTVSKVFYYWIHKMSITLGKLITWLPKEIISSALPTKFKSLYPNTTCIIDCTEIGMEKATTRRIKPQTYNNTAKFLLAAAPHGFIMFVSSLYGGKVSDKFITMDSGFLDHLKSGDEVMADRSFKIESELAQRGVILNIPASTPGKVQLSNEEATNHRRMAMVRIHIERVIRELKTFKILKRSINITILSTLDEIVVTCAALVNLKAPISRD